VSAADLDALDRGLVEVGTFAAEDRARIEALEIRVDAIFTMVRALSAGAGLPVPADPVQPQLRAVR
jgi:hypothetical protein